ncbi:peptidoglycan DD-metalloendopeptidase family protein [Deinococcus aquiradiocola]|uniref:Peptidase M23 n=1 Tax=Deinococcus aquiradiocola TaxID=393059 RepID=A0A917UK91_9DEIO|nr:M23 family metallopeptidase [Deinococcus aquiradiocola]GGJ63535.1 peptidase M23 [Deinococcus aquiradiocola]
MRLSLLASVLTLSLALGVAVPAGAQSGAALVYTVRAGDTLYRIATERGLNPADLLRLNNLTSPDLSVGQVLRLPSGAAATTPAPTKPAVTKPATAAPANPAPVNVVSGVTVRAPARLTMGDAFVLRLSGQDAGNAVVSFPSETGEDVRKPAEVLTPIGAAGEYVVLGRVVLGKTTPLVYTVRVGQDVLKGSVPVSALDQPIQHLTLAKTLTDRLKAPERPAEEKVVEAAYALRTPQAWSRPFSPPLDSRSVSSSFGQPRTYLAGGPVAYHYGMDFPAKIGTPVRAVNDGRVVIAATYPVRGGLVAIDHGAGLLSLYFHQSKLLVKVGQVVRRGDVIGQVGTTGLSAGPHLHLEMRVRGEGTLPTLYFNRLWP